MLQASFTNPLKVATIHEVNKMAKIIPKEVIMGMIKNDLLKLGIEMDVFTSEKEIISGRLLDEIFKILESKNLIFYGVLDPPKGADPKNWEKREQLLFKSSVYGDDTDRALKKSDGTWTYFATDMAYHLDKMNRTKGDLINVLGADHIGYIPRMRSVVSAITNNNDYLDILNCQIVRLIKDNQILKM